MAKRKVDNRIRILIENGILQGYRTLYILVGEKSKDQVVYIHHILSKASLKQATVLWCYKKNLTYSSHRKKRIKQLKVRQKYGYAEVNEDDPFEVFVSMTEIRYCYYKETHKILGNTFKMCVLQDFEALTPNILCRTIETVEGGGVVVILLDTMNSLKQLYTLNMDIFSRYRTEAHQYVVPRFNERFILSLSTNPACLVMDDQLRILPISSLTKMITYLEPPMPGNESSPNETALKKLKDAKKGLNPLGPLISICKTLDQALVVSQFIISITEKTLNSTITLTASRGRGKSAAMGLALAGAVYVGYSNMYVTSPSPQNLKTLFEFILKGLDSLGYEKHLHYETVSSSDPEHNHAVMRLTVTRYHRQIIQYISPLESDVLGNAELVIIDEAAAIPLPHVKALLGSYLVFLASTISGYEGTGRSLSLKLIQQLREQSSRPEEEDEPLSTKRKLVEVPSLEECFSTLYLLKDIIKAPQLSMMESIRYKDGDHVEKWLYDLLCLETCPKSLTEDVPLPDQCNLYYVNRDTLFGYHEMSERFLKVVMSLLVSSHYRNTPDDLQTLSDAPAHHIFVLLPPTNASASVPDIYCVVQVALEGKISKTSVQSKASKNHSPGDLIPWTVSSVFLDDEFPQLSGARIVRIATHPNLQGKGYGSKALQLLESYYNISASRASLEEAVPVQSATVTLIDDEEVGVLNEIIKPRSLPHPLLLSTSEREPEALHYLGVSFGASPQLTRFWKKVGFTLIYLSQISNNLTGEHSGLMLKALGETKMARDTSWLRPLWLDFRKRLINLLAGSFRKLDCKFALSILTSKVYKRTDEYPSLYEMQTYFPKSDLERMDQFVRNQCEASLVADIVIRLAGLYFQNKIPSCKLTSVQSAILVGIGVQRKIPSEVANELEIDKSVLKEQTKSLIAQLFRHMSNVWVLLEEKESGEVKPKNQKALEIAAKVAAEMENYQPPESESDLRNFEPSQFVIEGRECEIDVHKSLLAKKKKKLTLENGSKKKIKR